MGDGAMGMGHGAWENNINDVRLLVVTIIFSWGLPFTGIVTLAYEGII